MVFHRSILNLWQYILLLEKLHKMFLILNYKRDTIVMRSKQQIMSIFSKLRSF